MSFKANLRRRVSLEFLDESLTKQEFKDSCDINNIIAKYQKTGVLEHVNRFQGDYADVATELDYRAVQDILIKAHDAFDSLPSSIRDRFANDPANFLAFVENPDNKPEMAKLGLLKDGVDVADVPVDAVPLMA